MLVFFAHLSLLLIAWFMIGLSQKIFPKIQSSLSSFNEWSTILFFKPFQVMVSLISFFAAFLIIRYLTIRRSKLLFEKGDIRKRNRVESFCLLSLCLWILFIILNKHAIPALIVTGIIMGYDLIITIVALRRKRKIELALREFQR